MSNKKDKHKPKPKKSNFEISDIVTTISGLAASLMAIYGFVKAFKDDTEGFIWLVPLGAIIWLIILWQMFQKQRMYAYALLILTLIAIPVVWNLWQTQVQIKESKIVVFVAKFDGPEEKYGIRDELIEKLKEATKDYPNIEIATTEKTVNSIQGSEYARELGDKEHADIVVWAWYRPTENPNITIHIENLSPKDFSLIQESEIYQPSATIADLESFEVQKRIGTETANLVNFLVGYLQYQVGNYKTALELFDRVSFNDEDIPIINRKTLFLFSGFCRFNLEQVDESIQDYDEAIRLDLNFAEAYNSRGVSYSYLGQKQRAIQNYDEAIHLDPNYVKAYYNRGTVYSNLGQEQRAIQDYDKTVGLDPNYAKAYNNRGVSYSNLGQEQRAIQDFDEAIRLDPNFADAYYSRGVSYSNLGQEQRAIQDYDEAIRLDPNYAKAYNSRGVSYGNLSQEQRAIQDFDEAIRLDPNFADAYYDRGHTHNQLSQYESAIRDLDRAIDLYTNSASYYVERGASYHYLEQFERAIQDYNKAIQLDPINSIAYKNRGNSYQALGRTAEAEADFKKYEELTGEKPPSRPSP